MIEMDDADFCMVCGKERSSVGPDGLCNDCFLKTFESTQEPRMESKSDTKHHTQYQEEALKRAGDVGIKDVRYIDTTLVSGRPVRHNLVSNVTGKPVTILL